MIEETAVRQTEDKGYFTRRAAQERSAAAHASGKQAREAHEELAKRYRRLANTARDKHAGVPATDASEVEGAH